MSRAFTKEDDAGEPVLIPPRAALPPGTPNYVTPFGLEQLKTELADLESERIKAEANRYNEADRTRNLNLLNGKMKLLVERISSARIVDPASQPKNQVRFGATVILSSENGQERKFTITGVDEANVAENKFAFNAPIARAVIGKKKGEKFKFNLGGKHQEFEVTEILYQ
jgi:transcription elongation factor GreB